jgi:hypothetical protein
MSLKKEDGKKNMAVTIGAGEALAVRQSKSFANI